MVKFTRNKLASVYRKDEQTLSVHGILEDDIYGLEVDLDIDLLNLEIMFIRGKWNRMENSECPRAIPFLQEAVGFRLSDEDFDRSVQKIVGRKACRHFADLILECCYAAKDAARIIPADERKRKHSDIEIDGLFGRPAAGPNQKSRVCVQENDRPQEKDVVYETVIDLHVHSLPASPCSNISVAEIIKEAMEIGLNGICLTDHNHVWEPGKVEELRQKHGFLVLRGNEITTEQGDILVFGLEEEITGVIKLEELRQKVQRADGFMIVAHPFRGFLTFGMNYLGLTKEKAMERTVFKLVDAVEVLNSKVSDEENGFAAQVASSLGLPVTGGSDAHGPGEVGLYATRFPYRIENERDLIEAFRKGGFLPVTFRKK